MKAESDYAFEGKYVESNIASEWIIGRFFQAIADLVGVRPVQRVLEVGCGAGYSTEKIRRMLPTGCEFIAVDLELSLVEKARARNPDMAIDVRSIYDLRFPDKSFDLVIVLEVFEHLDAPERALAEVARVSDRWILASVPREPLWSTLNMIRGRYWSALGNTPGHIQRWNSRGFLRFLSRAGRVRAVRRPVPWTIGMIDVEPRPASSIGSVPDGK